MIPRNYENYTTKQLKTEFLKLVGNRHELIQTWIKENPDDMDHLASAVFELDEQIKDLETYMIRKLTR